MTGRPERAGEMLCVILDEAALSYAKKWKLVREDGTVKCHHDGCNGDATLPTLECAAHRKRRTGA